MTTATIPAFDHRGIVPPFTGHPAANAERSPYRVRLVDTVLRFSTSPERRDILNGFLGYRAALHSAGITSGFQWLNGSFLENVEVVRSRPPNDIDVVSFFHLPVGMDEITFLEKSAHLLHREQIKKAYLVDTFPVYLGWPPEYLVRQTAYWYSLWAHRKTTYEWKGFIEISMDPSEDAEATEVLKTLIGGVS